jgi:DNA polymerase-3 subunit gamma/tau
VDGGVDLQLLLAGLGRMLRALMAMGLGGTPPELSERLRAELEQRKKALPPSDVLRMLHALLELEPMYRKSGQPQLLLETLLVRFALLDRTVELEDVLKGFGAGSHDDPPPRRVAHDSRVASAHALPPSPPAAIAPALSSASLSAPYTLPSPSRTASQQVAAAAAAAQTSANALPPRRATSGAVPSLEQVKSNWSAVSDTIRQNGRGMLAQAVQRLVPMQISAEGALVLGHDPNDDTFSKAVDGARPDVLAALQTCFGGIRAFSVQASGAAAAVVPQASRAPTKRLTAHDVQQQRTEQLAAKDPLLDAAVKALDLELLD